MNRTKGVTVLLVAIALAVSGCRRAASTLQPVRKAESVPPAPQQSAVQTQVATRVAQPNSGAVVGHLKTRDKLITIQTGQNGPLYTVKSSDGQILAADLPAAELSAKFPELKEVVERGIADWAGMDLPDRNIVTPLDTAPVETFRVETITIEHNNTSEDIRR